MPHCSLWCVLAQLSTTSVLESIKYLKSTITKHCCCTKKQKNRLSRYAVTWPQQHSQDLSSPSTPPTSSRGASPTPSITCPTGWWNSETGCSSAKRPVFRKESWRPGRSQCGGLGQAALPPALPGALVLSDRTVHSPTTWDCSFTYIFWALTSSQGCFWTGNSQ